MHNLYINYGSESVDAAMSMANFLKGEKYLNKSTNKQLDLIEESIIHHARGKLRKWESGVNIEDIKTLDEALTAIKTFLETDNNQDTINAYFNQYIHAIVYTLGKIRKQDCQIEWTIEKENNPIEEDIVFEERNDGQIKSIITKRNIDSYILVKKLIDAYRKKYVETAKETSNNVETYVKTYSARPSVMSFGYQYTKKYPKK